MSDSARYANPGHAPTRWPADTHLGIEFAGGHVSRWAFTRDQLRWSISGHPFDVGFFWRAGK